MTQTWLLKKKGAGELYNTHQNRPFTVALFLNGNGFCFCCFVEYICIMLWLFLMFSLFLCFPSDEEKVGPWPRGPIFPFRKKALQRPRIFKVRHPKNHPLGLPACSTLTRPLPVFSFVGISFFVLFCSHLTYFVRS